VVAVEMEVRRPGNVAGGLGSKAEER